MCGPQALGEADAGLRGWDHFACCEGVLARRKPLLFHWLSGLFLLRLATRQFSGLLFQCSRASKTSCPAHAAVSASSGNARWPSS